MREVETALARWAEDAGEESRDAAVAALQQHRHTLLEHLDEEERVVMPLVEQHITAQEWQDLGDRGLAETPKNRRLLALGAILEDADQEEQAEFLRRLPGPARLVWRVIGQRQYRRAMSRIRGAAR